MALDDQNVGAVPPMAFRVVIEGPAGPGDAFPILDGPNLIGRWDPEHGAFPEIDLEGYDPDCKISRKHAVIEYADGSLLVEDLGSLNGTAVNGGPQLNPGVRVSVRAGDRIRFGGTTVVIEEDRGD